MARSEKVLRQSLGTISIDVKAESISLDAIIPNPYQPRKVFDETSLDDLTASIHEHGIIQPVLVREVEAADNNIRYELIAGERRFRAAKMAGLTHIPAIIRQASDQDLRSLALIENVQREDLNVLEKASAVAALRTDLGETSLVAKTIGCAARSVERYIRIHKEINGTPDFAEILQQADFSIAYEFATIAPGVRKLLKTDKREYDRTLSRMRDKGIKSMMPLLFRKFSTKQADSKSSQAQYRHAHLRETASEFILTLRQPKNVALTLGEAEAVNSAFREFMDRLSTNMPDGNDEVVTAELVTTTTGGGNHEL